MCPPTQRIVCTTTNILWTYNTDHLSISRLCPSSPAQISTNHNTALGRVIPTVAVIIVGLVAIAAVNLCSLRVR